MTETKEELFDRYVRDFSKVVDMDDKTKIYLHGLFASCHMYGEIDQISKEIRRKGS